MNQSEKAFRRSPILTSYPSGTHDIVITPATVSIHCPNTMHCSRTAHGFCTRLKSICPQQIQTKGQARPTMPKTDAICSTWAPAAGRARGTARTSTNHKVPLGVEAQRHEAVYETSGLRACGSSAYLLRKSTTLDTRLQRAAPLERGMGHGLALEHHARLEAMFHGAIPAQIAQTLLANDPAIPRRPCKPDTQTGAIVTGQSLPSPHTKYAPRP